MDVTTEFIIVLFSIVVPIVAILFMVITGFYKRRKVVATLTVIQLFIFTFYVSYLFLDYGASYNMISQQNLFLDDEITDLEQLIIELENEMEQIEDENRIIMQKEINRLKDLVNDNNVQAFNPGLEYVEVTPIPTALPITDTIHNSDSTELPLQSQSFEGCVYLESDIKSYSSDNIVSYPESGSFEMYGIHYFRGIESSASSGTVVYDIGGKGFTRLTGILGRTTDKGGTMTITGDGVLIDGYEIGETGEPIAIDATIPAGTGHVTIRFNSSSLGLGDALFSNTESAKLPIHSPPPEGGAYLESDIKSYSNNYIISYPKNGSFEMYGIHYFRGIESDDRSSTITYDIREHSYTKLTGTLGLTSGKGGIMTISCDNVLIEEYKIDETGIPIDMDTIIPAGTKQITIQFNSAHLGLGDALFL
jgi:hypothetical protein